MLHKIKIMGMDCFYKERLETSERPFNSDHYIEICGWHSAGGGRMNKEELKPMADQMRDRADVLEKALGCKLWCYQCCGQPHTFQVGFDLNVSAYLNFRERDRWQDYAQMKLALMKGIRTLQDKLKEVNEYEHNRQS